MKLTCLNVPLAVLVLFCNSLTANAGLVSMGSLTLENAGDIYVTDSLNEMQWLRWDQVNTLNFAQLQAAIGAGGSHEGWSIAKTQQAVLFHDALFGAGFLASQVDPELTSHTANLAGLGVGTGSEFVSLMGKQNDGDVRSQGLFIDNDEDLTQVIAPSDYSNVVVSYMRANFDTSSFRYNDVFWKAPVGTLDITRYENDTEERGYILYRDESVLVPEPSTFAILALGLMGLSARRSKKKS